MLFFYYFSSHLHHLLEIYLPTFWISDTVLAKVRSGVDQLTWQSRFISKHLVMWPSSWTMYFFSILMFLEVGSRDLRQWQNLQYLYKQLNYISLTSAHALKKTWFSSICPMFSLPVRTLEVEMRRSEIFWHNLQIRTSKIFSLIVPKYFSGSQWYAYNGPREFNAKLARAIIAHLPLCHNGQSLFKTKIARAIV